jgi:broad specificity phosphatase PhoE
MRIYLIRHADPDYDRDSITDIGRQEAHALAQRMHAEKLDAIFTSPMGRARETARYTTELTGLSATIQPWMAEFQDFHIDVKPWGTLAGWHTPGEVVRAEEMTQAWREMPLFADPAIVSTVSKMEQQSDLFLEQLGYERQGGRYRILKQNQHKVAVFAHGGFGLTWLAHLLGVPAPLVWCGFWLLPSSVTTILFEERSADFAVPRCLGVGDVSHLFAAGLPVQPRGIRANYY